MYRLINPFHATCLFLYPLKISENEIFSVSRGIERDRGMKFVKKHLKE